MASERERIQKMKYKPNMSKEFGARTIIEEQEERQEQRKKMAAKVDNYAKYVKEMYWPEVSKKKQ
jgi:hypothetical protein